MKKFFAALAAMLAVAAAIQAAPAGELDEGALPPGITRAKALEMLQAAESASAEEIRQEREALRQRAQRIEAVGRKYQAQIDRVIAGDPALKASGDQLRARFAGLARLGDAERSAQLDQLSTEAASLRSTLLAKAGINTAELQDAMRNAAAEGAAPRGADQPQPIITPDGSIAIDHPPVAPVPEVGRRGIIRTVNLTKPFPYHDRVYDGTESNIGSTDKAAGTYTTHVAVANGDWSYSRMGLTHFTVAPTGTRMARVVAKLPETAFKAEADTSPFSWGARSKVTSRIEVWRGGTRLCNQYRAHADISAGWYTNISRSGDETVALDCTVSVSAGSELMIRFSSTADIASPIPGFASGKAVGIPASIRVDFSN